MKEALRRSSLPNAGHPATVRPTMLSLALKMRRIVYFCRESMTITSDETFGIKKIRDPNFSSLYNTVPVPSVLDFQIDTIAIMLMRDLLKEVLAEMHERLFDLQLETKESWYEIFLVCFVLLSSLEKVHELQLKYLGCNDEMVSLF